MPNEDCEIIEELIQQTSHSQPQPPKKKRKTALEILTGEDDDDSSQSKLAEEFEEYFKIAPLKSRANILEWWSHNSSNFPNLAKLAKKYLCHQYLQSRCSLWQGR